MDRADDQAHPRVSGELAQLRVRVTGVQGTVITGVDGLLVAHEGAIDHDPHDLAALAAAAHGIGRQTGLVLGQGEHQQTAIQHATGHYVVYSINDRTLLAVVAETCLNIAQLHIQFRATQSRLEEALDENPAAADDWLRP